MKKFLRLLVLSTVAFASQMVAQTETTTCCFPTTFAGAGSTLQGQADTTTGDNKNKSLSVFITALYNGVHQCPTFTYNTQAGNNSPEGISGTIQFPGAQFFGGTDVPPASDQLCPNGPLLNWPVAVVGIVPFYNLPNQMTPLNFTAEILAEIFSGQHKHWSDVQAAHHAFNLNGKDTDPVTSTPITIVVRGDASGSTFDFTQYLSDVLGKATPMWTLQGFGPFPVNQWTQAYGFPNGSSALYFTPPPTGTHGVLAAVTGKAGAIGYVGYNNIVAEGLFPANNNNVGNVENPHSGSAIPGPFIKPNPTTFALAMQNVMSDPQLRYSTINSQVTGAYPIASPTNLVTLACQFSDCQAIELKKFLNFYITYAQNNAATLGSGALPSSVVAQFIKQLDCLASSESCISTKVCSCCVDKNTGLSTCCVGGTCPSSTQPCPEKDRCKDKCKDKCR